MTIRVNIYLMYGAGNSVQVAYMAAGSFLHLSANWTLNGSFEHIETSGTTAVVKRFRVPFDHQKTQKTEQKLGCVVTVGIRLSRNNCVGMHALSGSHGEWTMADDVIGVWWCVTLCVLTTFIPPLYLFYVLVRAVLKHINAPLHLCKGIKWFAICVACCPFFCVCYVCWIIRLFVSFLLSTPSAVFRRIIFVGCVCALIWHPWVLGWFLRRTFESFLNGLHGEYTNTDDMAESRAHPGRHIRRMQAIGALPPAPLVEPQFDRPPVLNVDFNQFPPIPASVRADMGDDDSVATEVLFSPPPLVAVEDSGPSSFDEDLPPLLPAPIVRPTRSSDILFMLPENIAYHRFFVLNLLNVFFVLCCELLIQAFDWLARTFNENDFVLVANALRVQYPIILQTYCRYVFPDVIDLLRFAAIDQGLHFPDVLSFRPIYPYMNGISGFEYIVNFLPEYNACYSAIVDLTLCEYLVAKFLAHKDVASTLNVMFEAVKKYDDIHLVNPDLIYNTVLYSYQLKKLRTRAASAARGKCDSQLVQLN